MRAIAAAACVICAACDFGPAVSRAKLRRGQVATERARVTGTFATESGGHSEQLWIPMSSDAVLDEAVLVSATPPAVCIELLLRASYDAPLDDYEMTLALDDDPVALPAITNQRVVEYDYRPTGERTEKLDERACVAFCPEERDRIRIVERTGRMCSPVARPPRKVELKMIHPTLSWRSPFSGRHRYQLLLEWKLKD